MFSHGGAPWIAACLLVCLSGCGYQLTYQEPGAEKQVEHLDFPRFDPPADSLITWEVVPPPVEAVILDAYYYYLIHPEGEEEGLLRESEAQRNSTPPRRRRSDAFTLPGDVQYSEATIEPDTVAVTPVADSTVVADVSETPPQKSTTDSTVAPLVTVDLAPNEEATLRRRARLDMEIAQSVLKMLEEETKPNDKRAEQIQNVRGLVAQAMAAMERRDLQGAANLALKARSLAEKVFEN